MTPTSSSDITVAPTEPSIIPEINQRELWEEELAERRATLVGECTYQEYINSNVNCTNKAILLFNSDFYDGTLTLDNGGYFKLAENIVFDPNKDGKTFI